jgi:hypothetical protein
MIMQDVSMFRLYVLRSLYLLVAVGLAVQVWPGVLHPTRPWELMDGVVRCMLAAFSLLCILGLRYPLQMLPILLWEALWKTLWLGIVVLPQWRAGHVDEAILPNVFACSFVVLVYLAVPWDYVWQHYVKKSGDRWGRGPVSASPMPV